MGSESPSDSTLLLRLLASKKLPMMPTLEQVHQLLCPTTELTTSSSCLTSTMMLASLRSSVGSGSAVMMLNAIAPLPTRHGCTLTSQPESPAQLTTTSDT